MATTDASVGGPSNPRRLPRELQVTALIGRGLTNDQIARQLVLSRRTVEWHVSNLLGKVGVSTRAQLAAWAMRALPAGSVGSVPTCLDKSPHRACDTPVEILGSTLPSDR